MEVTITQKWQLYIPLKVREQLNLVKPGKANIQVSNKKIVVSPYQSRLLRLAGKYEHLIKTKKVDLNNIRETIDYSRL